MSRRVLLVAGARALDPTHRPCPGTAASEAWARGEILAVLDALSGDAVVLSGRARGPDAWAAEHARARRLRVVEYDGIDGSRWVDGRAAGTWTEAWAPDWWARTPRERPLTRDRACVAALVAARAVGWDAGVLALAAPWAMTGGMWATVRAAREAGLAVDVRTCQRELGPGR